ncbi:MAG TPA: glycogen debranching N-terminal domain-containing protein, partial [Nitrolancea sp.]|nr:glycogen debranching N-terminal domain-containing protein [Nitrolancea sp.]
MTEKLPRDNPAAESVDVLRSLPTRLQPHLIMLQETPAITRSISDAVVIKQGEIFFLTNRDGNVPLLGPHGFGLYYHDCRYLNGYEFKIAGATYSALAAAA